MKQKALSTLIFISLLTSCDFAKRHPYQDTKLDFESRAADLVSRMTLEEKVSQLTHYAGEVGHLGIPEYNWWNECLHGVARAGKATVFPQAIGMAASFDRSLMYRMADATSTEARAKYHDFERRNKRGMYQGLTFWSPNINIFRDPRWGRGHETYGEDPYLTGELAVQFIRGLQGEDSRYLKVVATSKHFAVHSGPEPLRHSFDAVASERDFRDTYLPAFKKTVEKGHVYSVMCAYNRYMGEPCCGSHTLQEELLRGELGFEGYIVSDCGAIRDFYDGHNVVKNSEEAAALGVMSGTDLNCGWQYPSLVKAVEKGLIAESELDVVVQRLMLARMKLGMFDPDEMIPWADTPLDVVAGREHKQIALEMARKSIVLLKNETGLPIGREVKKVAVIGPNADNTYVQLGNYNGSPVGAISVLEGIRDKLGEDAELRFALGCPHHEGMPYLLPVPEEVLYSDKELRSPGLEASYYPNLRAKGEPVLKRKEKNLDVYWWDGEPPVEGLEDDDYSVSWEGYLVPRRTGDHFIGVHGKFFEFILDGDTLTRMNNIHHPIKTNRRVKLQAGRSYRLKIVMRDEHLDANCTFHWQEPGLPLEQEALDAARWADKVILVMGLTARLEGEEMKGLELAGFEAGDRSTLELPEIQKRLIRRIAATGKDISLVLMTGSAVSVNWEDQYIPSIVQAWYGGEAAGKAVADVLFGDYNPAGRLPLTFYKSVDDLPSFENYDMAGRTYRYFKGEALYPFGHGLSYTTFSYDNLILEKQEIHEGDSLMVSVQLSNTGNRDGEEVVQMYVRKTDSRFIRPLKDLCGFSRIPVAKDQSIVVNMQLDGKDLSVYDPEAGAYVLEKGKYEILVGPSSEDETLLLTELNVR